MSVYNRNYDFTAGTTIVADQVDAELNSIQSILNGNIDATNLAAESVTSASLATAVNPETRDYEMHTEFVASGLTIPTSADLTSSCAAGVAYIRGIRVNKSSGTNHTYTASKDTYVDLDKNGNFTYSGVANGAGAPAVATNSIRIAKVVSDGTKVASVTDMRMLSPVTVNPHKARAYRTSSNQIISDAVATKVQLNGESYDTNSNFDTTTDYRYTAPITGYYQVSALAKIYSSSGALGNAYIQIRKSGSEVAIAQMSSSPNSQASLSISDIIYLTAGEYLELWAFGDITSGTVAIDSNGNSTYLAVHLLSV